VLDHTIKIGIASPKPSSEPVPTALGNPLTVSNYLELTGLTGCNHCINVEVLLDEGHETRDLSLVILSRWAVDDLNLHFVLHAVGLMWSPTYSYHTAASQPFTYLG
jgi:hypothetical protein